jgi:hypothetical protein
MVNLLRPIPVQRGVRHRSISLKRYLIPVTVLMSISWLFNPPLSAFVMVAQSALVGAGPPASPYFTELGPDSGLDFVHFNGMSGALYLPEIMGSGAALFDYDNDGDLDIYLVQGGPLGSTNGSPPPDGERPASAQTVGDRLFRNDLTAGVPRFVDVTATAGIRARGYGMGVATGDFDNDGWTDLYVTNFGSNQLWRNLGGGRFAEVGASAGVADSGWGVSAAFIDYDRDGWLDLYLGNYVRQDLARHKPCLAPSSVPDYCTPLVYSAQPDRLFRNLGDGRFADVSERAGIAAVEAPALGVVVADYNSDGWPDIYVANDARPNLLWINQGDGRFSDEAFFSGAAVNMAGAAEGSMGIGVGDFDNDGDPDLFMTHLTGETNTIYVNDGRGWFEDRSIGIGLAGPSKPFTGFGTGWLDVNNDGWLDLFVGNGEVSLARDSSAPQGSSPLAQANQLFLSRAGQGFAALEPAISGVGMRAEVTRGAAFGDIDNDGDTDILVTNNNGPARLLINQVGQAANWFGLRLLNARGRDALGARVDLEVEGGSRWGRVHSDGSYASANDPRLLLGLGTQGQVLGLRVHWPDGRSERFGPLSVNRYHQLRYGGGERPESADQ